MFQILNCLISRQDFKGTVLERKPEHIIIKIFYPVNEQQVHRI